MESYFYNKREIDFDFRDIRAKGTELVTSGGKAPGAEPLRECIVQITSVLENAIAERGLVTKLKTIEAHDIMCYIADAVLAGGIRRAAMLALFSLDDTDMLECKFGNWWEENPQRGRANNSAVVLRSQITKDVFMKLWDKIKASGSGEPGFFISNSEEWGANPCCFTGDMKLLTVDGEKTFEELNNTHPTICDMHGNKSKGYVWYNGKKDVIRLKLSDKTVIKCTPDHKFLVDGNWIEAKDMKGKRITQLTPNLLKQKAPMVISIKDIGRQDVYDFNEPNTNAGYVNGACAHNCEISLRSNQFCNLVEVNFSNIESQEDLNERARVASFISTLQASYTDFHYLRDIWRDTTEKDALIGVSLTGVASRHLYEYDLKESAKIVKKENKRVAKLIGINPSARSTTNKPSGTSSIILGTSSGVHAWYDKYYWRRIRVGKDEAIYQYLFHIYPELLEDDYFRPESTAIIKVPQKAPEGAITREETAIDALERVKYMHEHWIDTGHIKGINKNNVSVTISIRENEWEDVSNWMWQNRDTYTGISVLPFDSGSYTQAPFESCTKEEYEEAMQYLSAVDLKYIVEEQDNTHLQSEVACSGGACEIKNI